jgi:acyl carrier protein
MSEILADLRPLVARAVDAPPAGVDAATRFEQVANWSSLAALSLLTNLESRFGVTLDLREYFQVETVGELAGLVQARITGDAGRDPEPPPAVGSRA